ncbi:helix-turn-helix domain-containing protein [Alicyclobacillus sp. ALC3]|uniref:helix-turn-helix domain-containing protein n=1 Tax=Alicyclobacillus sp. ALC3 TaxID=2796143 RepID=UPI0023784352|nr:helix-turn-helix transcriptional regulator [Alicyclobacillus sp. ALC3]WDL96378.1 helix-turn-helix transcriptional regulator [Alicyclobacillus sp. ALC3]
MGVGQALKISRKALGRSQSEVGVPYSQTMVAKIEHGEREIAPDMAPRIGQALDHPAILLELAREQSGGWGPAWLDGPNVDLHRAVVREMCLKELFESIEAVQQWSTARPPAAETDAERKRRYEHLMQVMDSIVALSTYIGVQCTEYGFSMLQVSRDHYARLKGKRYVRG